jgi:hypothetical protein
MPIALTGNLDLRVIRYCMIECFFKIKKPSRLVLVAFVSGKSKSERAVSDFAGVYKRSFQAVQKGLRCEAHETKWGVGVTEYWSSGVRTHHSTT